MKGPIALFVPSLEGGGAERAMLDIARGLSERGLAVDLVLVRAKGPYMDLLPPGVRIVDLDAHRALASVPRLRRYLRGEAPCVLLATLPEACVAARVATWLGRVDVPLVPTAR